MTRCQSLLLSLCSFAAACGTTSDAAPTAPAAPAAAPQTAATLQQQCVATMRRSRECTDQYIPALVDARARLDTPGGIAAAVKTDRDGVIAQARAEWVKDSGDDALAERCLAIAAHLTAESQADAAAAQRCVAEADCGAFVACVMPIFEQHLAK